MNRNGIIKRIGVAAAALNTLQGKTVDATWTLAGHFVALKGTFQAGQDKAFLATAATAAGMGESRVRNLTRAFEVRDGLSSAARSAVDENKAASDVVLTFAGMTPAQSKRHAENLTKSASWRSATEARKSAHKVKGTTKRNRQTAAEQTTKLAEKLSADFGKGTKRGYAWEAMAYGAWLAREYQGDVEAAIRFLGTNTKASTPVVK